MGGINDCTNEYFLDSGCTLPFFLIKYLVLFFFLNVALTLIVKNKQLGIIVCVYTFSQILLVHQIHLIIRSFVYIFFIPKNMWMRIVVGFFLLFQSILGLIYRDGLVVSYFIYLILIVICNTYQFKIEEVESDDSSSSSDDEDGDAISKTIEHENYGCFRKRTPELSILLFDLLLQFIYMMVYIFREPYGTYICFVAGSLIPFLQFFYTCIIVGDDKDKFRMKLAIYLFSYFLIDTPYTFPIRYCVYVLEIWQQETPEKKSMALNFLMGCSFFVLFTLCIFNEYTGIVITYAVAVFPLYFFVNDKRGIGIDLFFYLVVCIPLYFNRISMLWMFFFASLPGLFFSYYVSKTKKEEEEEENLKTLKHKRKVKRQLIILNCIENCYIQFVFVVGFGFPIFILFYVLLLAFSYLETTAAKATPF